MPKNIYLNSYLSEEQNDALLEDHSNLFVINPGDILTLKLWRDNWQRDRTLYGTDYMRDVELDRGIETLNRILKQVSG
jgi:hypothetical protein